MRIASAIGVSLLIAMVAPAVAAPAEPVTVTRYVLPGGLRLLVREDRGAQVVTASLQVRSGARYETPDTAGIGNFVQRVMLRGTSKRSMRQIIETAEDMGGTIDASADVDYAEVRGTALAVHNAELLELLADVALAPTFPADEVERERRLIATQIRTRADTPFPLGFDTLVAQLYGPHPYGLPALGSKSSIERLTRDDLVAHYRRTYHAGAMVLAVSGGVEREAVRRHAERLFGKLSAGDAEPTAPPQASPSEDRRVLDRPNQQAQILMGFLGPGIGDPDYAAGKVLAAVLGGGMAGRLFIRLRDDQGLAYSLGVLNPSRLRPGLFVAHMGTAPNTAETAERAMRMEFDRFRAGGPAPEEMARAKAYVLGNLLMDRRTNARQAWYLAFYEVIGAGWDYPDRYARAIEAVTAEQVMEVARRYLEHPTTVIVRPRP